jgi:hypothetical protein
MRESPNPLRPGSGALATGTVPTPRERGAILIVVLLLTVVFAVLSVALLSTSEISIRVQGNGQDMERAERAAHSAVELAAALVKENGLVDATRSATLAPGVTIRAQVRAATAPHLIGEGTANGVTAVVTADASLVPGAYPHALLSFDGTSTLDQDVHVSGDAYLDDRPPLDFKGGAKLRMAGNLELVTSTSLPGGKIVHSSGATQYGAAAITQPAWNTLRYTLAANWSVPITIYNGTTTLKQRTIHGIVVVNLLAGQTLTLDDCTIHGTVVVPSLWPPILDLLGPPMIEIAKDTTILGGTAETGNLAILAPSCSLKTADDLDKSILGVTYVRDVDLQPNILLRGQLLLRNGIKKVHGPVTIERPADFVPMVPHGIVWTGPTNVRITWREKQ